MTKNIALFFQLLPIAAIASCGSLDRRDVVAADHAKLERNLRVLLCGRALMHEKAIATAKIVESPIFDDRPANADMIVKIADRIDRQGC